MSRIYSARGLRHLFFLFALLAISTVCLHRFHATAQIGGSVSSTVVSAATYEAGPLAPESIAVIFGNNLAPTTAAATTTPLPTILGNASVRVRDSAGVERMAPLFFVSPNQINFLVPAGTATGTAELTISAQGQFPRTRTIRIAPVAPGLFSANSSGQGVASGLLLSVFRPTGEANYDPLAQFDEARKQFVPRTLSRLGSINVLSGATNLFLVLYGTGLRNRTDLSAVRVTVGGIDLPVTFAGAAPDLVGLDQINVPLPLEAISRLRGRGRIDVTLRVVDRVAGTLVSNNVEIEADNVGTSAPIITSVEPTRALAGEMVTIRGSGFSPNRDVTHVRVGGGIEAEIASTSVSEIKVKVPFGAESGPIEVATNNGSTTSATPLMIRTSVSGIVEDTRRRPIIGVNVVYTAPGVNTLLPVQAKTNREGVFLIPDVPLPPSGASVITVQGSTASVTPLLPDVTFSLNVVAGRDNQLLRPIWLQIPTGTAIDLPITLGGAGGALPRAHTNAGEITLDAVPLVQGLALDWPGVLRAAENQSNNIAATASAPDQQPSCVAPNVPLRLTFPAGVFGSTGCLPNQPCGAAERKVYLTAVENGRTPLALPPGQFSSTIAQITPLNMNFLPGADLIMPNTDCIPAGATVNLLKLSQGLASFDGPAAGTFFVTSRAVVSADGQRIEATGGLISTSSIYLATVDRATTTITGRVVEEQPNAVPGLRVLTPVRHAVVTARGQQAVTDGAGFFTLRNVPILRDADRVALDVTWLRAGGRVERALTAEVAIAGGGYVTAPDVVFNAEATNRPPVILASAAVAAAENARTDFNFTVSDADADQTLQVSLNGPAFATLINRGGGAYSLRLAPGFNDAGEYTVTLTATDGAGATATHAIAITVANVNQPPAATAQSVTTDEDTPAPITLAGTDPDRNALSFTIVTPPAHGTLIGAAPDLIYIPAKDYAGPDSFTFKVNDGLVDSAPAPVSLTVRPVNDAPRLTVPTDQTVVVGAELAFAVTASDVDANDRVALTAAGLPQGASFAAELVTLPNGTTQTNGQFRWTPTAAQGGTYVITFKATDDSPSTASVTRSVAITVLAQGAPRNAGMWTMSSGPTGGSIIALWAQGANVLAADYSGASLFRSVDAGQAWTPVTRGLPAAVNITTIVSQTTGQGEVIFAGTSVNGVFRSTDGGQSWTAANAGLPADFPGVLNIQTLLVKGTKLFASVSGGVFVSTDSAQSWTPVAGAWPQSAFPVSLAVSGDALLAGTVFDGIYRSTDDGNTWTPATGLPAQIPLTSLAANGAAAVTVYGGYGLTGAAEAAFYGSNDGGRTWTNLQLSESLRGPVQLRFAGDQLLAGTESGLFRLTPQAGASVRVSKLLDQPILALATSGAAFYAGTALNGVYRSTDAGQTWQAASGGLTALNVYTFLPARSLAFAGTSAGVYRSGVGDGQSWSPVNNGLAGTSGVGGTPGTGAVPSIVISALTETTGIAGTTYLFAIRDGRAVYRSSDLGASWQQLTNLADYSYFSALAANGSTLFVSSYPSVGSPSGTLPTPTVLRSTDQGATWTPAAQGLPASIAQAFAFLGANVFAATAEGVYVSSDNGAHWRASGSGLPERTGVLSLTVKDTKLFAGLAGRGVYISTDNGQSWTAAGDLLPGNAVAVTQLIASGARLLALATALQASPCPDGSVLINGQCFGGLNPGLCPPDRRLPDGRCATAAPPPTTDTRSVGTIYLSLDDGLTWAPLTAGLGDTGVTALGANNGFIFAGTFGRGVFVRRL